MIEAIVIYKGIIPYDWCNCQLQGHMIEAIVNYKAINPYD